MHRRQANIEVDRNSPHVPFRNAGNSYHRPLDETVSGGMYRNVPDIVFILIRTNHDSVVNIDGYDRRATLGNHGMRI